jgi:Ca2+-binding EF-hand superfamily protein
VRQAFALFDADRSGALSAPELAAALDRLGVQGGAAEVMEWLRKYDADGDGRLRLGEFAALVTDVLDEQALRRPPPTEVLRAFQLFDKDRDGRLRAAEMRGALKQLGLAATRAEAEGVLRGFERDGDGGLDVREFHRLVLKVHALLYSLYLPGISPISPLYLPGSCSRCPPFLVRVGISQPQP